jgi:cytochrome c-type biogenesis protein CcmH/NrfG
MFLTNKTFQLYQDGLNFVLAQKPHDAKEQFEKALEQEPDNVEILTRVAQCLTLEQDYDSAAEHLRYARRLNPYQPEIKLWLGRALHQRGEIPLAAQELAKAHQELPASEAAAVWYAEILIARAQKNLAIQILEEHLKKKPLHVVALVLLAKTKMSAGSDSQTLWSARQDLQVALSRLAEAASSYATPSQESTLAFRIKPQSAQLKTDIEKLLQQIEFRLNQTQS